jgi:ABC-type antimicrobial peptide transport system permease subunit
MSVRVAIGASRRELASQVLTETLILSLGAAVLGVVFSYWGSRLLVALMSEGYSAPVTVDLKPDIHVLSLTVSMAILTGILLDSYRHGALRAKTPLSYCSKLRVAWLAELAT